MIGFPMDVLWDLDRSPRPSLGPQFHSVLLPSEAVLVEEGHTVWRASWWLPCLSPPHTEWESLLQSY